MLDPHTFLERMTSYWTQDLGNACNPKLKMTWDVLCRTFNHALGDADGATWRIVAAGTGIGKSVGACVYASMLPTGEDAPGVLIITKFVTEAHELATRINHLAGQRIALDYHAGHHDPRTGVTIASRKDKKSDGYVAPDQLATWPVVIATHRALEISYDLLERGLDSSYTTLTKFAVTFPVCERRLIIVDEAIDIVREATINSPNLAVLRSVLDAYPQILKKYPQQVALIDTIINTMRAVTLGWIPPAQRAPGAFNGSEVPITREALIKDPSLIDFTELRKDLRTVHFDRIMLRRPMPTENRRLREEYDQVLHDLQKVMSQWMWVLKEFKGGPTLTTSFQLIPDGVRRGVILDASARQDAIYQLLDPGKAQIVTLPPNPRTYQPVRWHISTDHRVGLVSLRDTAEEDVPRVIDALERELGSDRKVLVVCHQDVERYFAKYITDDQAGIKPTKFAAFDVAHWGDLNGKNDWRDYDALLTYGLPYRPRSWAKNVYQAFHGPQSIDWLNTPDRPWKSFKDIVRALITGKNIADLVQAMNRIRCRRMVNADGSCPPVDIFSILPSSQDRKYADGTVQEDSEAMVISTAIGVEMPRITRVKWKLDTAKASPIQGRPSNHYEALVRYCRRIDPGTTLVATMVRDDLGITATAWKHLCRILVKKPEPRLSVRLRELDIHYTVAGAGRGARSYLTRGKGT